MARHYSTATPEWRKSASPSPPPSPSRQTRMTAETRVQREERKDKMDREHGQKVPGDHEMGKTYKEFKTIGHALNVWLVETRFPGGTGLPYYISHATKTGKTFNPTYEIMVNPGYKTLAKSIVEAGHPIPASVLDDLKTIIARRSEYSHYMEIKNPDDHDAIETHQFYIDTMAEVHQILSKGAAALGHRRPTDCRSWRKPASAASSSSSSSLHRQTSLLGKRKPSLTSLDGSEQRKTVKATAVEAKGEGNMPSWRCTAAAIKPMSYAAAAAVLVR